jgi:NodT family efflux transporter outer membrane factor (OMF) lipoprotein
LRAHLLCLLYCFTLSGCAYYGDIHGNSRPLNAYSLSTSHVYKPLTGPTTYANWWRKFKDPQLNQLINVALSDSPDMQIAKARVRQAQHLAEEASSLLWPSVNFSGYVQRQKFSQFGLVPPPFNGKTFNIGTVGFNFNYEFDFWGKNRQILMARVSEECAAQAELAQARLIISAAVANTYFQLRGNIAQVKIAKENWLLSKRILRIASTRQARGINSDIPVKNIQANTQAIKLSLEEYRQAELLSRHQLAVLLGNNPFTTEIKTRQFVFHQYHVTLPSSLPARLIAQRPDIYAAKSRAQAEASRIRVAKAYFFPDINLNALFSYQALGLGRLFDVQSQNNAITGAVDLPIFDAGARRANLGVKYAEYDLAVNEYNKTILTALREVADQLSILQSVGSQLAAQNAALKATRHNYKLFSSRYNHGIADYVQVLRSRQSLIERQSELIDLQTRHLQAVVATLKALGGNDFIGQG